MSVLICEPYDIELDPAALGLVVIDMQRDFLEEGGFGASLGNDVGQLRPSIAPCAALIAAFRAAGLPVIHTRECHKPDLSDLHPIKHARGSDGLRIGDPGPMGRILVAGEPGADIIPELYPAEGEPVIDKPGKGAFYATNFGEVLADLGLKQLVFAGVTTEVCVQTTMREANDRGFQCILATDATASYAPEFKRAAIEMIRHQGAIVGWTTTVENVEAALNA